MSRVIVSRVGSALVIVAGLVRASSAQPASAQAEVLFQQGLDLLKQGKVPEACDAFDAAEKLEATSGTLLRLADCRERNHQLATAWSEFLDAERMTRSLTDDEGQQRHTLATDRSSKLEPRVSRLTIHVDPDRRVDGMEIMRDGQPVIAGAWNQPLPVDGGVYRIVVRAPGMKEWSQSVRVENEGDKKTVDVPVLQPQPVTPAPPPTTSLAPAEHSDSEPVQSVAAGSQLTTQRWIAVGMAGTSAVALGVGIWAGLSARSRASQARDAGCTDDLSMCPSPALDIASSAYTRGNVATGMFIASGVLAAGAVVLWLTSHPSTQPSDAMAWRFAPSVSATHASVGLIREF